MVDPWLEERVLSHNATSNAVHGSFDVAFHLVPVHSSLSEFIHFFHSPDAIEAVCVGNYRGHFFSIGRVDQVDLSKLSESFEVEKKLVVLQGLNEFKVVVHVARRVSRRFIVE